MGSSGVLVIQIRSVGAIEKICKNVRPSQYFNNCFLEGQNKFININ